ncbi:hypothetical protein GCG54_00009155 [Colletotrichum gloeosporioides]|uniref:DUF6536 domain-containing protein n=1 Tax=Colletotrichum gloeosporioides TaxID=474922 RepID=A0A8H4C489_COLGL|nr:uncharacterized protein GCG54_00009155 [Colletotrichum gloeosporioides]KAF3797185.1 hypothetical protein GCG54_00009155 [Colletotrichum gloeosporioides]
MSIETKQPVTQIRPLPYENDPPAIDLSAGAIVASLVLVVNVGVLVWVRHRSGVSNGISTVFEGSCIESKKDTLWPDLAINIMSTLLLGASNSCAQLLSSPSRRDIDRAHMKGKSLDIGVPSVGNLGHIWYWRVCWWALLFLSSIPLHLVYSPVIFSTKSSVDCQAALVTQDFLKGAAWNDTELAKSVNAWSGPGTANCIQAYQNSLHESSWKNLLLVTSVPNNSSIIQVLTHKAEDTDTSETWIRHGNLGNYDNSGSNCDFNYLLAHASLWKIEGVCRDTSNSGSCGSSFDALILYCLAEQFPGNCRIQVSTTLPTITILFNAVKVVCLLTTAFTHRFEPLGTVGDAISSFLEQPHNKTTNLDPVTKSVVQKQSWKKDCISGSRNKSLTYKRKPHRWARAVSGSRWFICMALLYLGPLLLRKFRAHPVGVFTVGWDRSLTKKTHRCLAMWFAGLYLYLTARSGRFTLGNSLISNVLLANTPQIVISLVYLFYNNVFTCMVMAHEYARFASSPGLTASSEAHSGCIVPIMVIMAFVHWSISRSIYLVQLEIYDNNGELIPGRSINGCGYSPPPILLSLCLGGAMIPLPLGLSARKLGPGMPIAGSCSLAISAPAHAGQDEVDAAACHLQYGVISEDGTGGRDRRQVGFPSRLVEKPVSGETYAVR